MDKFISGILIGFVVGGGFVAWHIGSEWQSVVTTGYYFTIGDQWFTCSKVKPEFHKQ